MFAGGSSTTAVFRSVEFFATYHRFSVTGKLRIESNRLSRCNHTAFHLEKLRDSARAHEYAVTATNRVDVLGTLGDPLELWYTFKGEILEDAKKCTAERPKPRVGFVSGETQEST